MGFESPVRFVSDRHERVHGRRAGVKAPEVRIADSKPRRGPDSRLSVYSFGYAANTPDLGKNRGIVQWDTRRAAQRSNIQAERKKVHGGVVSWIGVWTPSRSK